MCTVSVITLPGGGLRLVTNRDESRGRPVSEPPVWRDLPGGRRGVWPIDPLGGGTWVGADDMGLVLTVLNSNPDPAPDLSGLKLRSRGLLIPMLLEGATDGARLGGIAAMLERIDLSAFAPFRLVGAACGSRGLLDVVWDRQRLDVGVSRELPACFASSGLGDRVVRERLPLFEQMVASRPSPNAQDRFHAHYWPDRLHQSVWMSRPEARTVSISVVEVRAGDDGAEVAMRSIQIGEPPLAREKEQGVDRERRSAVRSSGRKNG